MLRTYVFFEDNRLGRSGLDRYWIWTGSGLDLDWIWTPPPCGYTILLPSVLSYAVICKVRIGQREDARNFRFLGMPVVEDPPEANPESAPEVRLL